MLYRGVMWPTPASGLTHQRLCDAAAAGAAAPRLESFHCAGARQHHARGRSAVPAAQLLFVAALMRPLPSSRPPDPILSLFRREQDPLLPALAPLRHVLWQGPHQERPRLLALQWQRRHNRDGLRPQRLSMLFTRCHSTRLMSCGKMLRDMPLHTSHFSGASDDGTAAASADEVCCVLRNRSRRRPSAALRTLNPTICSTSTLNPITLPHFNPLLSRAQDLNRKPLQARACGGCSGRKIVAEVT